MWNEPGQFAHSASSLRFLLYDLFIKGFINGMFKINTSAGWGTPLVHCWENQCPLNVVMFRSTFKAPTPSISCSHQERTLHICRMTVLLSCFPFPSYSSYALNFIWYLSIILRVTSINNLQLNKIIRSWKKNLMLCIWRGLLISPRKGCRHTGHQQLRWSAKAIKTKINDCFA